MQFFLIITDKLSKGIVLKSYDSVDIEAVAEIFIRKFSR